MPHVDDLPSPASSRSEELPLSDWQIAVEAAGTLLPSAIGHRVRSTLVNLRKAWRLVGIDDEMSLFRLITAEEEAATALILALKRQSYPGASRLNHRNHVHKMAFWPLFSSINDLLYRSGIPAPKVFLSTEGPPRLILQMDITALAGHTGAPVWAEPDQPLNFSLRSGNAPSKLVHLFEEELAALASNAGDKSIRCYVERQANTRNRLLYASDDGVPSVEISDELLLKRAKRPFVIISLLIAVLQTNQHQLFIVQCLETLLKALESIGNTKFDYPEGNSPVGQPLITVERIGLEPGYIGISKTFQAWVSWSMPQARWRWPGPVICRPSSKARNENSSDYREMPPKGE